MYQESRPSFLERHQKRLGEFGLALVEWHDRNGLRLQRRLYRQAPPTLVHGDLRLDNLFFDDSSAGDQVLLADWQLMGRGPAAHDVAYFLSGALDGDASAMTEEALLRHYHAELVKGGVDDYPVDRLLRDYGAGLLAMLQLHGTADTVDVGEGRGGELMDRWLDRTLARLRNVDLDELA
jgi:thiamine kinase-like enzyme